MTPVVPVNVSISAEFEEVELLGWSVGIFDWIDFEVDSIEFDLQDLQSEFMSDCDFNSRFENFDSTFDFDFKILELEVNFFLQDLPSDSISDSPSVKICVLRVARGTIEK